MVSENEKGIKNEQEEFENIFTILQRQLLAASVHFYIWEQLWPTEKVVGTINQYKGFFRPTIDAHHDRFINKVSDVMSNNRNAPSFYRILNMIGRNSNLAADISVREVKKRLKKHKKVLRAIKNLRNKRVDHWDTSIEALRKPVLYGDAKKMLEDLKNISNEISASHSRSIHAFRYLEEGDTNNLLQTLKRKRDLDKKLIEYLDENKRCQEMILSLMNVSGF
jgi:ABC-type phosphate transport system auxiliary subunit